MAEDLNNSNSNSNSDGDGSGNDVDAALAARIQKAVDEATVGLKRTNTEIKGEKTELKERFDQMAQEIEALGGLDVLKQLGSGDTVRQLVEMQKRFQADEQGKLLAEGKYDEWFDRRTNALRQDHANQLKNLQTRLEEAEAKTGVAEQTLRKKILETEVSSAAVDAGVEGSALLDVQLRVANMFDFDSERGRHVLRDEDGGVVFGKDGATPKTIREWLEDQKEVSRHWWPQSKGSGADGSGRMTDRTSLEKLDMRSYEATRKKQGFRTY